MASTGTSSTPATPLLYSTIAHRTTILSEHATSATSSSNINITNLASVLLPKISHSTPQKQIFQHQNHYIYLITDSPPSSSAPSTLSAANLTYLVIARSDLGRRIPFGFLVEVKRRFLQTYDAERTDFAALPAYGAAAFNAQLKQLMVEYGTTQAGQKDAFANVQGEIDAVRGVMTQNIERVLERGERMDLLVDKTDRLGGSARDFRVRSRGLRRRMWWKNVKLMVLLGVVVVFLLYLLVGFGCGLPGEFFGRGGSDGLRVVRRADVMGSVVEVYTASQFGVERSSAIDDGMSPIPGNRSVESRVAGHAAQFGVLRKRYGERARDQRMQGL